MGHYEGFNALKEGIDPFFKRVAEIWKTESSKPRGKTEGRYELTIGVRNRRAVFEPVVTTGKGVKTVFIWNLLTEDIKAIKGEANAIVLSVNEVPYCWYEMPAILPGELPPESLPTKREAE
jgi:hypothetical protein